MIRNILLSLLSAILASSAFAIDANVRTIFNDGKSAIKSVKFEELSANKLRLTIPKETIADNVKFIDIVAPFAKTKKGDKGYWIGARGEYGKFDQDNGVYARSRHVMPIFAMKTPQKTFWGFAKTYRFDYDLIVDVKDGIYTVFPRYKIAEVRKWFDLYNDIVLEINTLEDADANYSGVARAYRKQRLDNGEIQTIKERAKKYPQLDYLCESIVVRIQTHCAKPIPDNAVVFTKETEQPIVAHMPFGVAEEFAQAIKDAGVDKITLVSAGWNTGGYDGRTPSHLPVEAVVGGEEGFKRFLEKTQKLGFQLTLHATNTDAYEVSPMWSPDFIGKNRDGSLTKGGVWAGGQCYLVCQNASWHSWVRNELKEIAKLGTKGPHYIDVFSATYPNRCCDKRHPATPEVMAEYQNKILAESKEIFGGAASESGYDHVAGNIDYINYIERDIKRILDGKQNKLVSGVFPLWEIVYHGIILYNSDRATQNHTRGKCLYKIEKSGDPRWMEGDGIVDPYISLKIVEFGGRPIFYTYKFADVPRIKRAWDEFKPVRHLQKELIYSHSEIASDVFSTKYENGAETISNYRKTAFTHNGKKIEAMSYILLE